MSSLQSLKDHSTYLLSGKVDCNYAHIGNEAGQMYLPQTDQVSAMQ